MTFIYITSTTQLNSSSLKIASPFCIVFFFLSFCPPNIVFVTFTPNEECFLRIYCWIYWDNKVSFNMRDGAHFPFWYSELGNVLNASDRFFCIFFLYFNAAVTMEIPTVKSCGPVDLSVCGLMIGSLQMAIHAMAFLFTIRFGSFWMTPITSEYNWSIVKHIRVHEHIHHRVFFHSIVVMAMAANMAWIYGIQEVKCTCIDFVSNALKRTNRVEQFISCQSLNRNLNWNI